MTAVVAVLVPLLPFLGSAAGLLTGGRSATLARACAVLPTLASALLAIALTADIGPGRTLDGGTRLTPTGSIPITLGLHVDGFALLIGILVGMVATCVQLYSTGYLRDDPRYSSYAALVSLFTAAMLLVVYSGDLIVLLVGWEVMGICSYFLIGHHWETEEARSASLKAFLVTKLGDVPFLFGLFALGADAGSFRITDVLHAAADGRLHHPTLIALLLLCGVAGKSAQFPLHTWLPDAMAGPTPISALIHAATMVAAGVYLVARLMPVFLLSGAALVVLAVLAAVTMVGSALCALAQDDIKRVLAYSTVGQLGYMTGALAAGDRDAAVFHLLGHGAFKALLFLSAGVLIHSAHSNSITAMARLGGMRRRTPDAFWALTLGLLALAGIPPFSGFFSKESVLTAAEHAATGEAITAGQGLPGAVPAAAGWIVLVAGLLTAFLTAAYATRLWLLTSGLGRRPGLPEGAAEAVTDSATGPESGPAEPAVMRWPLWLLAVPTLALGVVGLPAGRLSGFLDGVSLRPSWTTAIIGVVVALLGAAAAYVAWLRATVVQARALRATAAVPEETPADLAVFPPARAASEPPAARAEPSVVPAEPEPPAASEPTPEPPAAAARADRDLTVAGIPGQPVPDPARLLLGPLLGPADRGFGLDALYQRVAVRPFEAAASLVRFLDREVVETYVRGAAGLPRLLGTVFRRAQTGNPQTYVGALLAGSVLIVVLVAVTTR
ncbi:NADH-quinone oxidoreductase subunit 5 family protein [Phaeacidiphilus oryzae]|uniref:NADH-quinone oxidoreductase subunit 5 family protein n=1 Tax=Phaeacidiphilus oryzae TaxID=348818 RepID=UPI00056CD851|nr:NADH-quinone oxidoreductase subunit L [Phaeacidiphilus oryzae]